MAWSSSNPVFSQQSVVDVTKKAVAQLIASGYMGEDKAITYLDDQLIVDLGESLSISDGAISNGSAADIFLKSLIGQCGKIVVDTRSYVAQLPSLYVDTMNWGLFREHVMIELSDVMIDEMWNPNGFVGWNTPAVAGATDKVVGSWDNNGTAVEVLSADEDGASTLPATYPGREEALRIAAIEFGCYKPVVTAKLYEKAHAVMVALTTAREQLFTAFRNLAEYEAFVAGLFNSVNNTIQVKAEIYALMTVSMGIAKAAAHGNLISLRDEYAAIGGTVSSGGVAYSDAQLLAQPDFQNFMLRRISETETFIKRISSAYNDGNHVTFAADPQKILLAHAVSAAKFGVRANTYNEQLLGIGNYDEVCAWQGIMSSTTADGVTTYSNPYTLDVSSKIMLSADATTAAGITAAKGSAVTLSTGSATISGIVGVVYDRYAMGVTLDKKKVTSQYAASRDTVNTFYHALINYAVNDAYPIVAFTLKSTSA